MRRVCPVITKITEISLDDIDPRIDPAEDASMAFDDPEPAIP